jgi:Cu/Ag efflux pump CusA
VTRRIEETLAALRPSLTPDVRVDAAAFRQADFIQRAIGNNALVEGSVMVTIVCLERPHHVHQPHRDPLSLVAAVLVLEWSGSSSTR